MSNKKCTSCKIEQPLSNFGVEKQNRDGLSYTCKSCRKKYQSEYYIANKDKRKIKLQLTKEKQKEYSKRYIEKNKEKIKKYREDNKEKIASRNKERYKLNKGNQEYLVRVSECIWKRKGIINSKGELFTKEDYNTMLKTQNGVCAICGSPPNGRRLCLDHDHKTNIARGILCDHCNRGIGYFRESTITLEKAINYIKNNMNIS